MCDLEQLSQSYLSLAALCELTAKWTTGSEESSQSYLSLAALCEFRIPEALQGALLSQSYLSLAALCEKLTFGLSLSCSAVAILSKSGCAL